MRRTQGLRETTLAVVQVLAGGEADGCVPMATVEEIYTFVAALDPHHDAVAVASQLGAWAATAYVARTEVAMPTVVNLTGAPGSTTSTASPLMSCNVVVT